MSVDEDKFLRGIVEGLRPEFDKLRADVERSFSFYDDRSRQRFKELGSTFADESRESRRSFNEFREETRGWIEDYIKSSKEIHDKMEKKGDHLLQYQRAVFEVLSSLKKSTEENRQNTERANEELRKISQNMERMIRIMSGSLVPG